MAFPKNITSLEDFVENRVSINVFKLKQRGLFKDRWEAELGFKSNGISLRLVKDPIRYDWYINIENYGPTCRNSVINLIQTKCHFGGTREWLECPKCRKKVGILYKEKDDFECRKCLGLTYFVSGMNYRSLQPAFRNMLKLKEIDFLSLRYSYKHKITKRMAKYENLREKTQMLIGTYGQRYLKE